MMSVCDFVSQRQESPNKLVRDLPHGPDYRHPGNESTIQQTADLAERGRD